MELPTRIVVVDDHPFVQTGIKVYLNTEPDIEIVGKATNGTDAQVLCDTLQPDVMVLDLRMPGLSALDVIEFVKSHCPNTKILVFSAYSDSTSVQTILSAGVAGYILKEESPDLLLQAIRTVTSGATWFSRAIMRYVLNQKLSPSYHPTLRDLTERERDVLIGIAQGWSNAQIAAHLHLADQTVRNYTGRVYEKIEVASRTEALLWARKHGIGTYKEKIEL